MDSNLICPICFNLISDCYISTCGHSFCYQCIIKTIEINKKCPKCNTVLVSKESIIPNLTLNEIVLKYKLEKNLKNETDENKFSSDASLRNMLSNTAEKLSLADVENLLEILNRKKVALESETMAVQNELLLAFLNRLLTTKMDLHKQIQKEIIMVENDIAMVKSCIEAGTSKRDEAHHQKLGDQSSLADQEVVRDDQVVASNSDLVCFNPCPQATPYSKFLQRKKRIFAHFDDFIERYFACKDQHLVPQMTLDSSSVDNTLKNSSLREIDPGLDNFRQSLSKFSKYNELRCLATLSYSNDFSLASTIVSSVEFDKDNEYFAVAGVTKRIKIFDFYSAVKDALVDVKYPIYEMTCSSKISCVSWNSYLKEVLASSDYEGIVTIWNVQTGVRSQMFQEHDKRCWSVDFNEVDTRLLVSGSDDARVKFWSLNVPHSISTLEAKANVCCVKFNPASSTHLAIGSADHNVHYYDLRHMREPLCIFKGHKKAVSYVKFLNAHELVSAGTDGQLKLWDIKSSSSNACIRSYYGHINEKNFVGLATNGDYIACGSEDNSLSVYYKDLSKQLFSYKFTDTEISATFEPVNLSDGNEFVSAVCWRKSNDILMAGNSKGIIKILELY